MTSLSGFIDFLALELQVEALTAGLDQQKPLKDAVLDAQRKRRYCTNRVSGAAVYGSVLR